MMTSGMSHDSAMFMGETPLWIGFGALTNALPLELIVPPHTFALRFIERTKDSDS